jgi:hypothetical protein
LPSQCATKLVSAIVVLSCAGLFAQPIKTTFLPLSNGANGVAEPKTRIALIYTHPNLNNFNHPAGREMAARGYRTLMLNSYVAENAYGGFAPAIGSAIRYLRGLPGVEKVPFLTQRGGGPVMTFYQNVAENGLRACNGPEKIYSCRGNLTGWPKADGLVLLDSVPGSSYHPMTSIDPAAGEPAGGVSRRIPQPVLRRSVGAKRSAHRSGCRETAAARGRWEKR